MRYGIISDIHSNLEALEVAIEALSHEKIDRYLCVGDIVGYGADPEECIKKTKTLNPVIVCGNHDTAASDLTNVRDFNEAAKEAVIWTQNNLVEKDIKFLKTLKFVYKDQHLTLVHGTLEEPEVFRYMLDATAARATFKLLETQVCFVGHSHVPGVFLYKNGRINYFCREKIKIAKNERIIVNVGSIGQPRDGDPKLCYCIYDRRKGLIELKRLPYNVEKTQKKILRVGLPPFLAYRLGKGV